MTGDSRTKKFAAVYDEHVWHVYGYFGYHLRARVEVEDLTQTTFERALRAWHRFDPDRASARTWLLAIARNLLLDHLRRARAEPVDTVEPGQLDTHLALEPAAASDTGISPDLERALNTLRQRDREIVALRFGADLTGPEIADLTGLTLANVHQILSRSLRRIRTELEGSGGRTRSNTSNC